MDPISPISWPTEFTLRQRWLIGVSGGLDSMALLHLLAEKGYKKGIVCHLDHGLRGRASTEDARFVKKMGSKLGFEVISKKIDLSETITHNHESLETAARKARHHFFAECSRSFRCKKLFLGHHLDEQAETILWNLIRGSAGLRGMSPSSILVMDGISMHVFRPLLEVRKQDLQSWMSVRKLRWREDASNWINDVARNRIRNEVLPLLNQIAKRDVTPLLVQSADYDSSLRDAIQETLKKTQILDPQGRLHLETLRNLPKAIVSQAITDYLKSKKVPNLSQRLIQECVHCLDLGSSSKVNLPGGRYFIRRAGRAFVENPSA